MITVAAQCLLDVDQLLQQRRGIAFIIKFNDRIQKFSPSRFATDRFSLVNRRAKSRWLNSCEIEYCLSPRAQILKSIANIRTECDCGSHFREVMSSEVETSREDHSRLSQPNSSTALGMTK